MPGDKYETLPLERLKTEAERWIPYVVESRDDLGNAARGLRDIVQRAYDLGTARSAASLSPFDKRAADRMAAIVDEMIYAGRLDSRSKLADARLDYGQPFTSVEVRRRIIAGETTPSHARQAEESPFEVAGFFVRRETGWQEVSDREAVDDPTGTLLYCERRTKSASRQGGE